MVDPHTTWTFSEFMLVTEACLRDLDKQVARLSAVVLGILVALWPDAVAPSSVTRLARWLEAGWARLHAWQVSVAHLAQIWLCALPCLGIRT